jgi:hypothetical protein
LEVDKVYRDINYYSYSIKYNNRYEIQDKIIRGRKTVGAGRKIWGLNEPIREKGRLDKKWGGDLGGIERNE